MLSEEIKGLITELEKSYYAYLVPILDAAIEADGTDIKNAIEKRALEYELKLTQMMLSRIHAGIYELAQTKDDFEYLYFTIRRLMVKLACDVKDFNSQFAAAWSSSAEDLDLKLSAYISLLDKLREEVFTPTRSKERDPLSDPEMPAKEFNKVVAGIGTSVAKLKEKLAKVIRKEAKPKSALWLWTKRVLKLDRKQMTADMVENELASAKQRGLVSLIRICKRYTKVSVYLESEDLVETDESKRHYALPSGKNGLSRLPILITLYEDKDAFDVEEIKRTLDFDILKNVQAWDDALYRDNRSAPAAG